MVTVYLDDGIESVQPPVTEEQPVPDWWRSRASTISSDIEVFEDESELRVELPLHGASMDDVSVDITGRMLKITIDRKPPVEVFDDGLSGIPYGRPFFRRLVRLPDSADASRASARCRNGVLRVRVPKVGASTRHLSLG